MPHPRHQQHPEYASPEVRSPAPPRSAFVWTMLLLAWIVGLAVWAVYLVAFGYIVLRIVA